MTDERTEIITVGALIGKKVRELREVAGYRQEDVAREMQAWGFESWTRSSVAALEAGTRGLAAEELLILPWVFERLSGHTFSLKQLLESDYGLALTKRVAVIPGAIPEMLHPSLPAHRIDAEGRGAISAGEADFKLARKLGVNVPLVLDAAIDLWGGSLSNERDRRLQESAPEDASAASKRALRGHITRQLTQEARKRIESIQQEHAANLEAARKRRKKGR